MTATPHGLELVAVDDGYDFTKARTRSHSVCIPTAYSLKPSRAVNVMGSAASDAESVYEIEGARYAVGPNVAGQDTRFEEFPFSAANLAVALNAIQRVVAPGARVQVVTGLPLNRFYKPSGEINRAVSAKKIKAWSRIVQSQGDSLPRICNVTVISEAVAAWFDYVIKNDFSIDEHRMNELVAVVDIGGRTTDIAVLRQGELKLEFSGTLDRGFLEVQKHVADLLSAEFPGTRFSKSELVEAARFGRVQLGNGEMDVSADVLSQRHALATGIQEFMQIQFGTEFPRINRVIFVGGGAAALEFDLRERFPKAYFSDEPQFANARGMLKYGVVVADSNDDAKVMNA